MKEYNLPLDASLTQEGAYRFLPGQIVSSPDRIELLEEEVQNLKVTVYNLQERIEYLEDVIKSKN